MSCVIIQAVPQQALRTWAFHPITALGDRIVTQFLSSFCLCVFLSLCLSVFLFLSFSFCRRCSASSGSRQGRGWSVRGSRARSFGRAQEFVISMNLHICFTSAHSSQIDRIGGGGCIISRVTALGVPEPRCIQIRCGQIVIKRLCQKLIKRGKQVETFRVKNIKSAFNQRMKTSYNTLVRHPGTHP